MLIINFVGEFFCQVKCQYLQDLEEYKYTCESGHVAWTPMNSNLCMQGIKVMLMVMMMVSMSLIVLPVMKMVTVELEWHMLSM